MAQFSTSDKSALERTINVNDHIDLSANIEEKYSLQKCKQWIQKNSFQNICLQFPDHQLHDAPKVAEVLRNLTGIKIFILADTSYGSCCVDGVAARHVDAEGVIHFGPACLSLHSGVPVLYVFDRGELNVKAFFESVSTLTDKTLPVFVFYDTKYYSYFDSMKDFFSSKPNVHISSINADTNKNYSGSLLCGRLVDHSDFSTGYAIFIGSSECSTVSNLRFILPDLKWYVYENECLTEFLYNTNKLLMKRSHLIEQLKDANVIGVVVATLSVESYLTALDRVKSLCRKVGKRCYTLAVGHPNVAKLANFPEIDAFVLISCLENPLLLDNRDFYKPITSFIEVELAFGGRKWSPDFTLDFRELLPGGRLFEPDTPDSTDDTPDVSLVTGRSRAITSIVTDNDTETKVLCLHGYRQDAVKFRSQSGSLRKMLRNLVDFDFISAPHVVPEEGDASRSWWFTKPNSFSSRDDPPTCEGLDETLKLIERTWQEKGPYDGLLGFSQGACLVGILSALQQRGTLKINSRFVVLFSAFKSKTDVHKDYYSVPIDIPSLHVVGETDEVIPCDWGEALATIFVKPHLIKHPGGHFVPGTSNLKSEYIDFFTKQRSSIFEEGGGT